MAELTVKASMPMVEGGIVALNRETDLQLAEAAMPANIQLIEGMLINDPDNTALRNYAAQAYYGYAYGFVEDFEPQRAIHFYQRGLGHALYNLEQAGLDKQTLYGKLDELERALERTDEDDVPALFWAASNWAKWIDHNRNSTQAIADLSRTLLIMQRVMQLDEHFFMGGPHLFFAVYYGSRSPMLGGNFEKSEMHFRRAGEINQHELLLVDLLRAEFLDRQKFDQQGFHQRLKKVLGTESFTNPEFSLINNIARRKAQLLLEKESQWF